MSKMTSVEQSRQLAQMIGHQTADMCWVSIGGLEYVPVASTIDKVQNGLDCVYGFTGVTDETFASVLPAWSFDAMLKLMPGGLSENWMVQSLTDGRFMASYSCPVCHKTFTADTSFEAVFNMVVWHLGGDSKNEKGVTDGRGTDCDTQERV